MSRCLFLIAALFLFQGCKSCGDEIKAPVINESYINSLVQQALDGDSGSNDLLGNLADLTLPPRNDYNQVIVEKYFSGRDEFYAVLLENPNPLYNRLAVYDSSLNLYFLDKSLNGNLDLNYITVDELNFFTVKENFIIKDTLLAERLSVYQLKNNSADLSLRIYTELITPRYTFRQQVTEISEERIMTDINSSRRTPLSDKSDIFLYDGSRKKYISATNLFDSYILNEIKNFENKNKKPQISDEKSAMESVGYFEEADTISHAGNTNPRLDFSLTLNEDWKELKVTIDEYIAENIKGVKYLNNKLGSYFIVVQLPSYDEAEGFINYELTNVVSGKYNVRYSDKIEEGKNFLFFFEYSCGGNKFLLILKAPKYTYEVNKEVYNNIINSFYMEC